MDPEDKRPRIVRRNAAGIGDKQIEQFFRDGLIKTPADIFALKARDARSLQKLKGREGFGETSVRNLFRAIEERHTIPLNRFIFALGIRHVGETNARRLARYFGMSEGFFLGLQMDYDLMQRRREIDRDPKAIRPRAAAGRMVTTLVLLTAGTLKAITGWQRHC